MSAPGSPERTPGHSRVPGHSSIATGGDPEYSPRHPPVPVALFAGTTEGRELAQGLAAAGIKARVFVATEYGEAVLPAMPGIEVHVGRLDEARMREEIRGMVIVVDATHPYALEVSRNIRAAAQDAGVRYLRLLRPAERIEDASDVQVVDSAAEAARVLARTRERALITTGSKELACFTAVPDFTERLFVRILPMAAMVDRARALGFPVSHIICMQGPFTRELNAAMMRQIGATCLVTKESGRAGGFDEKLAAARAVGGCTVVIRRPVEMGDESGVAASPDEALACLRRFLLGSGSGGEAIAG